MPPPAGTRRMPQKAARLSRKNNIRIYHNRVEYPNDEQRKYPRKNSFRIQFYHFNKFLVPRRVIAKVEALCSSADVAGRIAPETPRTINAALTPMIAL